MMVDKILRQTTTTPGMQMHKGFPDVKDIPVRAQPVHLEMACRATCKLDGPQFPDSKRGQADQSAYVEANWSRYMEDMTRLYDEFVARQKHDYDTFVEKQKPPRGL